MSPVAIEDETKNVYAHFGAAAARASGLEMVLSNILLANAKRSGKVTTDEEFKKMETMLMLRNGKTLGQFIKAVNAEAAIPAPVDKVMTEALERRNYLIHHFFRDKAFELATEAGRKRLVKELLEAQAYILTATNLANEFCMAIAKQFGITIEDVKAEAEQLREKARKDEQCRAETLGNET